MSGVSSSLWIWQALALSAAQIGQLVTATGPRPGLPGWTYSDIRTRLYPAALSKAYPRQRLAVRALARGGEPAQGLAGPGGSLMARLPLHGRRIHIAGSIVEDVAVATADDVRLARELVVELVKALVRRGANFVVPVDAEPKRKGDGLPICFDWLVWQTLRDDLVHRPAGVPGPMAIAVQHHKSEDQIPAEFVDLWDDLRSNPTLVQIENAAHWNMASKRMEAQARSGDILVALGGTEGVLFLANLYHDAGKPIVPLNLPLCLESTGARRLYNFGLASHQTRRPFQIAEEGDAHHWLNRIRFPSRQGTADRVRDLIELLRVAGAAAGVRCSDAEPDPARVRRRAGVFRRGGAAGDRRRAGLSPGRSRRPSGL